VASAEFMGKLYNQDPQLFMAVLCHTSHPFAQYRAIPEALRSDGNVDLAILQTNESSRFAKGSLGLHLRESKDSPEGIAQKHINRLLRLLDTNLSRAFVCAAIVVSLCKFKEAIYAFAPSDLRTNLEVVKATLSGTVSLDTNRLIPVTTF
jgi:hypothetical protein